MYTKTEWRAFVRSQNSAFSETQVKVETERLWGMAHSRLCDQETIPWTNVLELQKDEGVIVAIVSSRRACVASLKPVLRAEGLLVTFGRPGDAMSGLRAADPSTWVLPWIAKSVGAVSAAIQMASTTSLKVVHFSPSSSQHESGKCHVKLVYLSAEMGTGSQSEWEKYAFLKQKILQEIGDPEEHSVKISAAVVSTEDVLSHYGFEGGALERAYYGGYKKLIFLRHGESECNASRLNKLNPRLTHVGHSHAVRAGSHLRTMSIETVVTSPHIRCLQTLQELGVQTGIVVSSYVGELNRGELQNRLPTPQQLDAFLGEAELETTTVDMDMAVTGENNESLVSQALKFLTEVAGQTILVVSHRVLIRELTGTDVENGGMLECDLDHGSIENVKKLTF